MHSFVETEENDQDKVRKSNQGVEGCIFQRQFQTIPPIPHGLYNVTLDTFGGTFEFLLCREHFKSFAHFSSSLSFFLIDL